MKLIFDQNLSPRLVVVTADLFAGSTHVHENSLGEAADERVWEFARAHGFIVVSKDSDFVDMAILKGPPPKIISITLGNCSTAQIESLLRMRFALIEQFNRDPNDAVLVLP